MIRKPHKLLASIVAALVATSAMADSSPPRTNVTNSDAQTAPYRLVYFFNPHQPTHARRAGLVSEAARNLEQVAVLGVVTTDERWRWATGAIEMELIHKDRIEQRAPAVAAMVPLNAQHDLLLLENRRNRSAVAIAPEDQTAAIEILATLLNSPISTKVDFTTWGKVKELFN